MASGAFRDRIQLTSGASDPVINTYAQSAALDWIGSEQAVVALGAEDSNDGNYVEIVSVLTFDNGKMTQHQRTTRGSFCPGSPFTCPWVNGLALGRFAAVPNNQSTDIDLGLQIATLRNDGKVTIYSVDAPTDYTPVVASQTTLDSGLLYYSNRTDNANGFSWLVAGDLQGRSAHLGTPSVFRIASHSQPSVILGAPPMHVDYILPDASTGSDWEIVNFSAVPDTYNSSYTMSQTTSNQSSDTSKTSYTYTTTTQGGGSFSLKPPYLPAISGSLIKTTEDKNETVSENYSFTQNEFKYNASTTTGFGDEIWYDASSFNLYVYPVLGQSICPEDAPNCTPAQEQPLYLMFSGPNSAGTGPAPGATTEWYQPVHEPGNIFSYPWNEAMLAQQFSGGIDLLTGPQHFFTDTSTQSQSLDWSSSSDTSQTAGTTNNHSYDKAYSLTAGKIIGKVVSANLQGNLDYNDSSSTSTLNKSSSSLGSSQGIEIKKPGTFLNIGLYRYRVEPYIFGRIQPGGTVDSAPLTEDIQTYGPLQAAFAVNPLDSNAGSWWISDESPYTQFADVALNHPSRWSLVDPSGNQESLNCLSAGGRNNCMVFNDPNPASLWNSEFYWMRGLYITVDGANGPQRTQATAGDELTLQARVYNYSFMDMPADARIQVRFYRQQLSGTTPVGSSVLISQVSASPLPGFNSDTSPDEPNWRLVTTTMDTAGLDNTYQIFWVLVWAEDSTGSMITELPGHGLSAKPGSLATIGDVPLEEVTLDGAVKTFSNNVGYLHSKFYIAPETTQAPPPAADPVLSIESVQITPSAPEPGRRVVVSADIFSVGAPADAVHVRLYPSATEWYTHRDDPAQLQPNPFDVELLPHIASGKSDRLEVPYQTNACGKQEILIVVEAAATAEAVTASATYDNGPCLVYFPMMPIRPHK